METTNMETKTLRKEKFIFFDLDGTLFDFKTGIPDSAKEALKLLNKNGHKTLIATGRTKAMIFDEFYDLGFSGMVCGGGTYVEFAGEVLMNHCMEADEALRLINVFKKHGMEVLAEGTDALYYDDSPEAEGNHRIRDIFMPYVGGRIKPIDYSTLRVSKVSGGINPDSDLGRVKQDIGTGYKYAIHQDAIFESFQKDFTKARGIRLLADSIGIDMDNTYAFGDSFNDYDMLKTVKYGVVMGNGDPGLKKRIPLHTDGFNEDGINNGLKRLGLI